MMITTATPKIVDRARLALPNWDVSAELLVKFGEYNDDVDGFLFLVQDSEKSPLADGDPSSLTTADLRDHRHARQDASLQLAQSLVELFERRAGLLDEATADTTGAVAQAERRLESTKNKIRKQLTQAGCGLESQQGWPKTPRSAEIQFDHHIARSAFVRSATAEHHDSTVAHKLALEYAVTNVHDLAAARGALRELVGNLVAT